MSNIGSLIAEQTKQTEEFKARKTAEREELSEMTDTAIGNITQEPEAYLHYLDVQADNPGFSVSNVLLAMQQYPEVTVFNSVKGWNAQGRSVIGGETGIKVRVSENYIKNGRTHRGYKVGRVFDITQTTGNRAVSKTVLADNTPQMQLALRALLYKSPVKVNPVRDNGLDAYYDPQRQIIDVSEALPDSQTFAALAREIFRAKVHDHGRYTGYTREETELDATSASYMLCRSFGVLCKKPDATKLGILYEGMEPQDARGILDSIQGIFREMQGAVQNEITPQQEQKRAYNQQAR
ncbi:MAG: hypothetical protein IJV64_13190 [Oscillospiraceae bacterium]|nr:hypothetical protein [Oscillospiraceae bacterium]